MKLEFLSKSLDYKGGEPYKTRVVLGNSEGVIYPAFFDPDFVSKESGELFKLALEQIYQENFPKKAENDKFNQVDEQLQKNKETASKAEQAATENKQLLESVSAVTEVLIALAIGQSGGMPAPTYSKVAAFIKPLIKDKHYFNNDIVSMPYPFDTNPKWAQGTATIFKF
ncbi:DUF1366 domain-containing protein, partial [Streptococcus anginosus]|nr:DUF1366 domain-containing protein [Streptococcus anginosus]MED5871060.1 DUF1366 domain-containing protein [Streptococcus anginosus]MED5900547.1 DUF1366 domain-containing protein [Streptococcus anginosus]MED5910027.1 DUF1366 domain-containing protein [Streptococcus anginosus]MED5970540.1 DUF1366 domain-containing protein [Streptococcus anginosus]